MENATRTNSSLHDQLEVIRSDESLTIEQKLTNLKDAAIVLKTNEDPENPFTFIDSRAQVDSTIPNLWGLSNWLQARRTTLTKSDLVDYLSLNPVSISTEQLAWVWDNLLIYELLGGSSYMKQAIYDILRTGHVLVYYNDLDFVPEGDEEELRQLLRAKVILPETIFPLPVASTTILTPPEDIPDETESLLKAEVLKYQIAIGELYGLYEHAQEIARNQPAPPTDAPPLTNERLGTLTQDHIDGLSPDTQALLTQHKVVVGMNMEYAMKKFFRQVRGLDRQLWGNIKSSRKTVLFGGAIWQEEIMGDDHSHEAKLKDDSPITLNDYWGFYPSGDNQCRIKPLGIADFRRLEQKLCCYKPGEVAHIENILQGELKERAIRRLSRREETFTSISERESINERDSVTTDRYEMQAESSKVIQEDRSFDLGMTVAGGFGPVDVTVNSNVSNHSSSQESDKNSVNYAKEVTERALQRITERVRTERSTKTIEEFEENAKHILDNIGGSQHVVGIYRWVDKIYQYSLVNYGKRLMFEFMIPEPAAFHLWAMTQSSAGSNVVLEEPIDPKSDAVFGVNALKNPSFLTEVNYLEWASRYGAEVDVPPAFIRTLSKAYGREGLDATASGPHFVDVYNDLTIPEGYNPVEADVNYNYPDPQTGEWLTIQIGNYAFYDSDSGTRTIPITNTVSNSIVGSSALGTEGTLPVSVTGRVMGYILNVTVKCLRSAEVFEAWQIKTFNKIMAAYQARKAEYATALAEAKARLNFTIQGTNPRMNRMIEQTELKKGCLNSLFYGDNFSSWSVWHYNDTNPCNSPVTNTNCADIAHGEMAKFLEKAFDWKLMTYLFLPYYWGNKCRWKKLYQLNDSDPLFLNFLQSGMARVLVPVSPSYEGAILHFLKTRQVPSNLDVPFGNSEIELAIAQELENPIEPVNPEGVENSWEVRIPTSLTILQCDSGCIDEDGLPCDCEESNFAGNSGGLLVPGNNDNPS